MDAQSVLRLETDNAANMACEDSLEFMRQLPNGCMKLIVASPPYN
jgi:DNA modification methylase